MNNQNPLIPQGSVLEQRNKGRARVKIAVFFVLALHGIGLMALLMQGCGQPKEPGPGSDIATTNETPAFAENTNVVATTTNPPAVTPAPAEPPPPVVPAAPAGATEYTVVKGDYLEKIAKNANVTVKALTEANPGIVPTKLKIGQKIHIPAAAAPAATTPAPAVPAEPASTGGEQIYTVKSGDNLTKIAAAHGVSVKALRTANALKTDSIKVGQKLKIPAKAAAPAPAPSTLTEPAPTSATPAAPAAPAGR